MTQRITKPLVCVVGPTASGKTELAQRLAECLNYSVLSADSMQVYRGMDIGTGKIPVHERTVPYFGLDLVNPGQPYSAALYQDYGREVVERCDSDGSGVVVCGGTGFYIRALIDDYTFPPGEQLDNPIRNQYTDMAQEQGAYVVWQVLEGLDRESALCIAPNDVKRVIRALEMHYEGVSYAQQKDKLATIEPFYPTCMIGISRDPLSLANRINARVDAMMEDGLLNEVEELLSQGYREAITAIQAIGYKELMHYIDGQMHLGAAIDQIKTATRQYAKRQRTWFRKETRITWLDGDSLDSHELLHKALAHLATNGVAL